jgi:NADH pyrophosphatase NudC (nudix superfamily)
MRAEVRRVTQEQRLARRAELRADITRLEAELAELREAETRLLEGCEHVYADGRSALAGGHQVRICAICGQVPKHRDEKLWG